MATKLFSFSLCNGTSFLVIKVAMFDEDKQETITTGYFTKCGDMTTGPSTQVVMDPSHALCRCHLPPDQGRIMRTK